MYHIPSLANRITRIIWGIIFFLLLITVRLFYLQISWTDHYSKRGEKNFLRFETIHSPRGNILDRNGHLLATNRPMPMLYWQGTGNKKLSESQIAMLEQLEAITNLPIVKDPQLCRRISYAEKQYRSLLIAADISFDKLSKIEELFPHNTNLIEQTHFIRHYPNEMSLLLNMYCAERVLQFC